jgi:hypothetical protein
MSVRRASVSSQVFVADKTDATVAEAGSDNLDDQAQKHPLPRSKFARAYRSTLFNVIIAGLISFTQPGIWNALNSQSTAMLYRCESVAMTDTQLYQTLAQEANKNLTL